MKDGSTKELNTYNARIGHRGRFAEPRGVRIDLKKSRTSLGAFMGVRLHPDLDESS